MIKIESATKIYTHNAPSEMSGGDIEEVVKDFEKAALIVTEALAIFCPERPTRKMPIPNIEKSSRLDDVMFTKSVVMNTVSAVA